MTDHRQTLKEVQSSSAVTNAAIALMYTGVILTILEYFFLPTRVEARLQGVHWTEFPGPSLTAGIWWAVSTSAGFLLIPLVLILAVHRQPPRNYGYQVRGAIRHLWLYLALFLLMLPVILLVARRDEFLQIYPFVQSARHDMRTFLIWETFYLLQFFALESFFRGYLLFSLERAIGKLAIFVAAVPYCMIHYHKPYLESFGALIAGVVLATLALRWRSWLGGALLHCAVAATMDFLSAHRSGLFD